MHAGWAGLRARWWAGWARFFPEDATSLGSLGHAHRLRERDGAVGDAERAFHDEMRTVIETIPPDALDDTEQLEREAMSRASAFRAHMLARDHDRTCLELSLHPQGMIAHHLAHARDATDLAYAHARLDALPSALAAREAALREGLAKGHAPDRSIADVVVTYGLAGAERWYRAAPAALAARGLAVDEAFGASCARAADATARHRAFVATEMLPRATDGAGRLGEDELTARLALTYGEPIAPRALRSDARAAIALLSAKLVLSAAHAARGRGLRVRDLREARAYVGLLFGEHLPKGTDPRTAFREQIELATKFAAERRLFSVPARPPELVPIPDGTIHGGAITNWPAPLLDRSRRGHVAVALDPSSHALAFAPGLAVHEATPGHYLQSAAWQALADPSREPVRFVAVHDDVAMASSFFGAMPAIEGFAVHAEEVMFDAGFFDRDAEVASIASAILRAARAAVDVSLHLGEASVADATHELADATGMPAGWCASQVVRLLRIPIQATTYFVGARRHRAMLDAARVRRGAAFRADVFHDALLALGPASLGALSARLGR